MILVRFWIEVIAAILAIVTWPLRAVVRLAKRERWGDPR